MHTTHSSPARAGRALPADDATRACAIRAGRPVGSPRALALRAASGRLVAIAAAGALALGACGGPSTTAGPSGATGAASAPASGVPAPGASSSPGVVATPPGASPAPTAVPGTIAPGCATGSQGTRITVLVHEGPWASSMSSALDDLEAATGIAVDVRQVGPDRYAEALAGAVEGSADTADVVGIPFDATAAAWAADGALVPMDAYLADPRLTDAAWDLADFPAGVRAAGETPAGATDAVPYAIPTTAEVFLLYANRDLVDAHLAGKDPATLDDLVAGARTIAAQAAGGRTYGALVRGVRSASTVDPISAVTFDAWGSAAAPLPFGLWFEGAWARPRLSDPPVLAGLTAYAALLDAGPPNAAAIDRPDARTLFSQGRAGFLVESSAIGPSLEDPATSQVAGKVGFTPLPPAESGGGSFTGALVDGLAIPSRSAAREAAWCFIAWATSPAMTARIGAVTGAAPRLSAWADPAVAATFDPGFVAAMRAALTTARPTAVLHAGWDEGALAVVDLVLAIAGGADPEAAATRQDRALRRMMAP